MRVGLVKVCAMVALVMSACGTPGGELATQMPAPYPTAAPDAGVPFQPTPSALPTLNPTPTSIPTVTPTPEITYIYQQDLDLKGNIGSVEVDFLWIHSTLGSSYHIKIYKNDKNRPLLWESDALEAWPSGTVETVEINGKPWVMAYWPLGAHSLQAYPIMWDGNEFQAVASYGMDDQPAVIACDEGFIYSPDGYITAYFRSYQAPNRPLADAAVWMLLSDGFHLVREYEYLTDKSDITPPTSQLQIHESPNQNGWHQGEAHLVISASDNDAVQAITYTLKNSNSLVKKTAPLDTIPLLLDEGRWSLAYYATDMSANVGKIQTEAILVDGTAPKVAAQIMGKSAEGGYPAGTSLTLHATDPALADGSAGSGIDRIEYSRDGGSSWEIYSGGILFNKADVGVNTILYRAIDRASNQSQAKSIQIKIDG